MFVREGVLKLECVGKRWGQPGNLEERRKWGVWARGEAAGSEGNLPSTLGAWLEAYSLSRLLIPGLLVRGISLG